MVKSLIKKSVIETFPINNLHPFWYFIFFTSGYSRLSQLKNNDLNQLVVAKLTSGCPLFLNDDDNADYNLIDCTSGKCWGPVMDIIEGRDKQYTERCRTRAERGILMT